MSSPWHIPGATKPGYLGCSTPNLQYYFVPHFSRPPDRLTASTNPDWRRIREAPRPSRYRGFNRAVSPDQDISTPLADTEGARSLVDIVDLEQTIGTIVGLFDERIPWTETESAFDRMIEVAEDGRKTMLKVQYYVIVAAHERLVNTVPLYYAKAFTGDICAAYPRDFSAICPLSVDISDSPTSDLPNPVLKIIERDAWGCRGTLDSMDMKADVANCQHWDTGETTAKLMARFSDDSIEILLEMVEPEDPDSEEPPT